MTNTLTPIETASKLLDSAGKFVNYLDKAHFTKREMYAGGAGIVAAGLLVNLQAHKKTKVDLAKEELELYKIELERKLAEARFNKEIKDLANNTPTYKRG